MHRGLVQRTLAAVSGLVLTTAIWATTAWGSPAASEGAVYVQTNASTNQIVVFDRDASGTLSVGATVSTGGAGTNAALGSQGSVVLSDDGAHLFAVNAGSNQISSFAVSDGGHTLTRVDLVSSHGIQPVSLAVHGDLLYVVNAMGLGNITGYRIGADGSLQTINGSTRHLSAPLVAPAEVAFNPAGTLLMVTERGTSLIDTYTVDSQGIPGPRIESPSVGLEPFGFGFDPSGHAVVSEAFAGGAGLSASSSYAVAADGTVRVISPSVHNGQTATCWVAITSDGRLAFESNTGSDDLSSYMISRVGVLSLRAGVAASTGTGSAPTDLDLDGSGHLYVLTAGLGVVQGFQVGPAGSLRAINAAGSLPPSASGLAAL